MYESSYWHEADNADINQSVFDALDLIQAEEEFRMTDYKTYTMLYKDRFITGFMPGEWRNTPIFDESYTWNVVRSCIDTLTSKVASNMPAVQFLTDNAKENVQELAKARERLVEAVSFQEKLRKKARLIFRDACVYGTGVLKIFPQDNFIRVERVHPSRLWVDNNGTLNNDPREMFHVEYVSKEKLKGLFPKYKEEIAGAPEAYYSAAGNTAHRRLVKVVEAWHLAEGDKPGKHVIAVENQALVVEDWPHTYFPFAVFRYADDLMGFYGIGLAEQLRAIQQEISFIIARVQDNVNLLAVPYVLKHKSANIKDEHIGSNETARIIEWEGNVAPQVITPPAVNQQVLQYLENLYQKAYEISGLSQLSATSQKPAGLNSGVALRTFYDIETQRFGDLATDWEQYFVKVAELIVEAAKRIGEVEVTYADNRKGKMEKIKFTYSDEEQEGPDGEENIEITIYPSSMLPQTPAGRLERVTEMVQAGLIGPDIARQLLDFPDLDKYNRLENAAIDDLERQFEHMLDKGDYIEPLPYQNLSLGIKMGTSYYLRARMDGVSQSRLDLVARWIEEAAEMLAPPPPPPAAPALPGMPGPEMPVAPPVGPAGPPQIPGILKPGQRILPQAMPPEVAQEVPPVE